jgi:hypothetical protein
LFCKNDFSQKGVLKNLDSWNGRSRALFWMALFEPFYYVASKFCFDDG